LNTPDKKIVSDAKSLAELLSGLNRPIVFTNGCFDILHRGHVDYLKQAAELGKTLIVGVNTDESVRKLNKGDDRPVNTLADRAEILAALESVDIVAPFSAKTPIELIKIISPDFLVKGGDWPVKDIIGYDFVTAAGGTVKSIPFRFQRSTTALLQRIRAGD
jgi:rfaE bifunctional protein nucleotidyltransferase chain/domain